MKTKKTFKRLVFPMSHSSGRCSILVLRQQQPIFCGGKQREPSSCSVFPTAPFITTSISGPSAPKERCWQASSCAGHEDISPSFGTKDNARCDRPLAKSRCQNTELEEMGNCSTQLLVCSVRGRGNDRWLVRSRARTYTFLL